MMSARFTRSHGFGSWIPMTKASCGSLSQSQSQPCNRGQRSPPSLYPLKSQAPSRSSKWSASFTAFGDHASAWSRLPVGVDLFPGGGPGHGMLRLPTGGRGYRPRIEGRGQRKSLTTGQYIVYIARRENVYSTVHRARGRSKQPALIPASLLFTNLGHATGEGGRGGA
jgi:hypothetical protein